MEAAGPCETYTNLYKSVKCLIALDSSTVFSSELLKKSTAEQPNTPRQTENKLTFFFCFVRVMHLEHYAFVTRVLT
jgi:hypothetical protein